MIDKEDITALVLAGGQSRRMGGRDKGLLPYRDGTLAGHIVAAIQAQVGAVLISANRNRADYAALGKPVLGDAHDGFQGPLAGFESGLAACTTDYLLTVPCDGPIVVPDMAARFALAIAGADIAVAHDGRRLQPVYALLHVRTLPSLRAALRSGERKIDRWYAQHDAVNVDFSDVPQQFENINTPEDYAALVGSRLETTHGNR